VRARGFFRNNCATIVLEFWTLTISFWPLTKKDQNMTQRETDHQEMLRNLVLTNFANCWDAAKEYLYCISKAPIAEQGELFQRVISLHDALCSNAITRLPLQWITEEEFDVIYERIGTQVMSWANQAFCANGSLEDTAKVLWEDLQLKVEGSERIIALGIIISHTMVPYVQTPSDLICLTNRQGYEDAHNTIPYQIALVGKYIHLGVMSEFDLADALTRLLEGIDDHNARVAFVYYALRRVKVRAIRESARVGDEGDNDDEEDDDDE